MHSSSAADEPKRKSEQAIVRTVLGAALGRCYDRTLADQRDRTRLLLASLPAADGARIVKERLRRSGHDVKAYSAHRISGRGPDAGGSRCITRSGRCRILAMMPGRAELLRPPPCSDDTRNQAVHRVTTMTLMEQKGSHQMEGAHCSR